MLNINKNKKTDTSVSPSLAYPLFRYPGSELRQPPAAAGHAPCCGGGRRADGRYFLPPPLSSEADTPSVCSAADRTAGQ